MAVINSNILSNDVVGPPPFITPTKPLHTDHNPFKILSLETVDSSSQKVDFMWDYGEPKTANLPTITEHIDDQKNSSTFSQESSQIADDWQILADEFPSLSFTPENNNNNNNNNDNTNNSNFETTQNSLIIEKNETFNAS
jgi:hypothetical protein